MVYTKENIETEIKARLQTGAEVFKEKYPAWSVEVDTVYNKDQQVTEGWVYLSPQSGNAKAYQVITIYDGQLVTRPQLINQQLYDLVAWTVDNLEGMVTTWE